MNDLCDLIARPFFLSPPHVYSWHFFCCCFFVLDAKLKSEKDEAEKSMMDVFFSAPSEAYYMIMDPNKKEREEEEKLRKEVKASKRQWRAIRKERFGFLDATGGSAELAPAGDEKKMDQ